MKGQAPTFERATQAYSGDELYGPLNDALRLGGDVPGGLKRLQDDLDATVGRSTVGADVVAYRGVSGDLAKALLNDPDLVGSVLEDRAYTSVSLRERIAQRFDDGEGATLEIGVPKNAQGAAIAGVAYAPEEAEVLLHRGNRMRIIGIDRESRRIYAEVEP